jgi:hypothetical protein
MKQFVALLLLAGSLFPQCALAACDNPETGKSKMFFVSIYTVSGCNPNDNFPNGTEVIEFTPVKKNGDVNGATQAVPLSDECKRTKKGSGLSCIKSGRTPLAGAIYVTTRDMKDGCDESGKSRVDRLSCVKGCESGRAPKHIEGSPWEC